MSVFSICIGLKGFIIDVDGMKRNCTEKRKNNTYNNKLHKNKNND
jgi:hypothetical protein